MNLSELKTKYRLGNGAKYEPDQNCRHCKGAGEAVKAGRLGFCACLFFEPSFREEALRLIAQSVRTAFGPRQAPNAASPAGASALRCDGLVGCEPLNGEKP